MPLSAEDIVLPDEPSVMDVPDLTPPPLIDPTPIPVSTASNTNRQWVQFPARLTDSSGHVRKGVLIWTKPITLEITNIVRGIFSVDSLSLFFVKSIEVKHWKGTLLSNDLYRFEPSEYRVTLYEESEPRVIRANLPDLNEMIFEENDKRTRAYTLFYDLWVSGKRGIYRWENSRGTTFPYNDTHPIPGVIVKIELLDEY